MAQFKSFVPHFSKIEDIKKIISFKLLNSNSLSRITSPQEVEYWNSLFSIEENNLDRLYHIHRANKIDIYGNPAILLELCGRTQYKGSLYFISVHIEILNSPSITSYMIGNIIFTENANFFLKNIVKNHQFPMRTYEALSEDDFHVRKPDIWYSVRPDLRKNAPTLGHLCKEVIGKRTDLKSLYKDVLFKSLANSVSHYLLIELWKILAFSQVMYPKYHIKTMLASISPQLQKLNQNIIFSDLPIIENGKCLGENLYVIKK